MLFHVDIHIVNDVCKVGIFYGDKIPVFSAQSAFIAFFYKKLVIHHADGNEQRRIIVQIAEGIRIFSGCNPFIIAIQETNRCLFRDDKFCTLRNIKLVSFSFSYHIIPVQIDNFFLEDNFFHIVLVNPLGNRVQVFTFAGNQSCSVFCMKIICKSCLIILLRRYFILIVFQCGYMKGCWQIAQCGINFQVIHPVFICNFLLGTNHNGFFGIAVRHICRILFGNTLFRLFIGCIQNGVFLERVF